MDPNILTDSVTEGTGNPFGTRNPYTKPSGGCLLPKRDQT